MRGFLKCILTIIFLSFGMEGVVFSQDTHEQEEKKAQLEREIAIIDQQLAENKSKSSNLLANLSLLNKKVSNRKELLNQSNRRIRTFNNKIHLKQKEINILNARLDTLTSYYNQLIKVAYKNRDTKKWYMYILASENLGQAFRRLSYFKNMSFQIRNEAEKIKILKEELAKEKAALYKLKVEAEEIKKVHQKELNELSKEEKQVNNLIKSLQQDKRKYQNQLNSKKKQVNALNREIERMVSNAIHGGKQGKSKKKPEIDIKLASEFSKNKGKLPWPLKGPVVDRFGVQYHPVYKKLKLLYNNGINIAGMNGAEVTAVFDGVVKQIVVMPGYNKCVLVQHGNYFSFYCKLKSVNVKAGDKIKTGQLIGKIDTINGETHLHLQIWKDSTPQDPELWLR